MFNVSDTQILLDNIPTDEKPDSDLDNPDFTPDPLPSLGNVGRLSFAAAAVDEGASSDEKESRTRSDVIHQWRKRPLDKQQREFSKHEGPVEKLFADCHTPGQYFSAFFDDEIVDDLVYQTNL